MTTEAKQPYSLPPPLTPEQRQELIALPRSWREVDEEGAREQRETGEYFLMKALDEDRPEGSKLFPKS